MFLEKTETPQLVRRPTRNCWLWHFPLCNVGMLKQARPQPFPDHQHLCRNSLKAFIRLGPLVVIDLYKVLFQHAVEHNSGTNSNTGRPTIYVTKGKSLYEWNECFQNMNAGNVNALGGWVFLLGIRIYFSNNMCVVGFRV